MYNVCLKPSLPHQEPCACTLRAAVVTVPVGALATNAAQQSEGDENQNDEEDRADDESSVVTVDAVLGDVVIGSIEVAEGVVARKVGNGVNLLRQSVAYVEHRLTDFVDGHFHFRDVGFNDVFNFALDFLDFLLARVDSLLETSFQKLLDVADYVSLVRKLHFPVNSGEKGELRNNY